MTSITLNNVSLVYRLFEKLTLSAPGRRRSALGGNIAKSGTKQVVQALDGVSFELKAGDRLGLVGPNGAGKTTLLKVLYGIYQPSGGTISITGKVDALFNIHIGFRPEATGRRNIVLRGLISGWTAAEIEEKMEEIIDFSELGDFIDLPFKAYSQGMLPSHSQFEALEEAEGRRGMPDCAGVALGFDRVLMIWLGIEVFPFPLVFEDFAQGAWPEPEHGAIGSDRGVMIELDLDVQKPSGFLNLWPVEEPCVPHGRIGNMNDRRNG